MGLGLGANYTKIDFFDEVNSDIKFDKWIGGKKYKESHLSPIIKFLFATELNFDKKKIEKTFLGGILLNFNIYYIFENYSIFKNYKEILTISNFDYEKKYSINNLSIEFSANLSLNFYKNNNER